MQDNLILINGNIDEQQPIIKINKTADKTAYMREYMKPYIKQYRINNLEHFKVLEKRKIVRKKMRSINIEPDNSEIDSVPLEEWNALHQYIISSRVLSDKPFLKKYI